MNGSAKRLMAIFVVLAMIASASVFVLADGQDSSATVDGSNYYYSQLEEGSIAQKTYDALSTVDFTASSGNPMITITGISSAEQTAMETDDTYAAQQINRGLLSAGYDDPLAGYYIHCTNPTAGITKTGSDTLEITINRPSQFSDNTKTYYDGAMSTAVDTIYNDEIDKSSDYNKVTSIHSYVVDALTYFKTGEVNEIRNVYTGLCGDKKVVCEGYAKLFKVLCDKSGIQCILVIGKGLGDTDWENHMWNYVKMDDMWYLVDCTWDDQSGGMETNYLLAGENSDGFNGKKISEDHDPCGMNFEIAYPVLSAYSYGDSRTQYLVTFKLDAADTTPYKQVYCGEGDRVSKPADPKDIITETEKKYFNNWYLGDAEYNFSSVVTSELTLIANWSTTALMSIVYDTMGGTDVASTKVEIADPDIPRSEPAKVTDEKPFWKDHKFLGWNTAKDGKGITFEAGDEITIEGTRTITLYAMWEDTTTISSQINSYADLAAAFLSKETIPGINNLLLTIGVITTVVSLLAILAISRK